MLRKVDVNMTADGVDKLTINMVNSLHLPHGRNCKPNIQFRNITSPGGGYSLMLFNQELCHNQFFLYVSNRRGVPHKVEVIFLKS